MKLSMAHAVKSSANPSIFRYLRQAYFDVTKRPGDSAKQNVNTTRTAQSALQGNLHVPRRAVPASWRHPDGLSLQQEEYEKKGDDWLVLIRYGLMVFYTLNLSKKKMNEIRYQFLCINTVYQLNCTKHSWN